MRKVFLICAMCLTALTARAQKCAVLDFQPGTNVTAEEVDAISEVGPSRMSQTSGPEVEYVELGLSVKWAACNLGADKPEQYGNYYAWGETETKKTYDWPVYKWCSGSLESLTKYNTNSSCGRVDNRTYLEASDDVAKTKLGGKWHMPTDAEWTELRKKCTWTWTVQNGVNGYRVTSKINGNSIFLPAAGYREVTSLDSVGSRGYYLSSSLYTEYPFNAWLVYFDSGEVYGNGGYRCNGFSVRPVSE